MAFKSRKIKSQCGWLSRGGNKYMDKKEILINTQIALFFDNLLEKPEEIWQSLNNEFDGVFDKTPIILPVPKDQQLNEVPVVQMGSNNGVYSCNIARVRVDFFVAGEGEENFTAKKDIITNISKKLFDFFKNKNINIKRIGFVTRFFIEDEKQDETIAKLLNDNFKNIHDGIVYESYIKYVSRDKILDFEINNYTTIEKFSANIPSMGNNIKGVLITRDFNTILEKNFKEEFDINKITIFIEKSENKFKLEDIKKILW